jgi:amino acid transporter
MGMFFRYSSVRLDLTCEQAIVLPLELVVAGLTVQWWEGARGTSVAVWIVVFFLAVCIISLFGVLGYAEEEFWVSILKLSTIVVFLFMGVIFVCGGGPAGGEYAQPDFPNRLIIS